MRVVLLGRQRVMMAGLGLLLDDTPGFQVLGEFDIVSIQQSTANADKALSVLGLPTRPDVVVVDIDGVTDEQFAAVSAVVALGPRLIVMASSLTQATLVAAFQRGATGAVSKEDSPDVLLKAIRRVSDGEIWLDRLATTHLVTGLASGRNAPEAHRIDSLTKREREVVSLVGQGLRNAQMADALNISEITVRNHLTAIFRKLQVPSRFKLALFAFAHGLSTQPELAQSPHDSTNEIRRNRIIS